MRFFYKIFFALMSVSLLHLLPFLDNKYIEVYYEDINIEFNLEDDMRKRYINNFKPISYMNSKPKKMSYVVEYLDISSRTRGFSKMGKDEKPIWTAKIENNRLKDFVVYRRGDIEQFFPNSFIAHYKFNSIGQIEMITFLEKNNGQNQEVSNEFTYDSISGYLIEITSYINSHLDKKEIYTYKEDFLSKKAVLQFNVRLNVLEVLYYINIETDYVEQMKRIQQSFYNNSHQKFKSNTEYYLNNQLVFSEDSLGIRKVYNYNQNDEVAQTLFLDKDNEPIKSTYFFFEKNPEEIYTLENLIREQNLRFVKNIHYGNNISKLREEIFEYNPLGELKNWVVYENIHSEKKSLSKNIIIDDSSFQFTYDSQQRLVSKKLLDGDNFILGQYEYRYNNRDLLDQSQFTNSTGEIVKNIKYFYDSNINIENKFSSSQKDIYYPENFYFSYANLIDLLINQKKNKNLVGTALNEKNKLIKNLVYAHDVGMKKIIFYKKEEVLDSYIRIDSKKNENGSISLFIYYYGSELSLPYKRNASKSKKVTTGYYEEFNEQTYDNIAPQYENLKESIHFLIHNGDILEANRIFFNNGNRIINEIKYIKDKKILIKKIRSRDEILIDNYITKVNPLGDL